MTAQKRIEMYAHTILLLGCLLAVESVLYSVARGTSSPTVAAVGVGAMLLVGAFLIYTMAATAPGGGK